MNTFINSGDKTYNNVEEITKKTASLMIQALTEYQNGKKKIPDTWRLT